MGRRGPLPKPANRAVGHRKPSTSIVRLVPRPAKAPPSPKGLSVAGRREWREFWASQQSQLLTPVMLPALRRLFLLRDRQVAEQKIYDEMTFVKGSTGQIRVNPIADQLFKREAAIVRLENEFGLTLGSAARLGVTITEAARGLDDLNRRLSGSSDRREVHEDPYAALLEPGGDQGRPDGQQWGAANTRG